MPFDSHEKGNGFHITFKNGWTVSVQWRQYNHCEHQFQEDYPTASRDAEVAVITPEGEVLEPEGWCSAETALRIMQETAAK